MQLDEYCGRIPPMVYINQGKEKQEMVPKVVLPPEDKQPEFKEMVDHGAIGVFENFLKWEFCDSVIDAFEYWHHKNIF